MRTASFVCGRTVIRGKLRALASFNQKFSTHLRQPPGSGDFYIWTRADGAGLLSAQGAPPGNAHKTWCALQKTQILRKECAGCFIPALKVSLAAA